MDTVTAAKTPPIPVAAADLSGNEEAYVVEAIRSSWISSTGKFVSRFEQEFAAMCGTRAAIGVCNGTVALHLALLGLDVRPGDEVLVPSLTYIATANAVRYVGAEPVFVDVDSDTWCIDPKLLEASITRRTKGIIAVHLYGHPADMDAINHIAAVHGLWVVEDAAEAHLATYNGRPVGGLADVATFSFLWQQDFDVRRGRRPHSQRSASSELRLRTLRGQGMGSGAEVLLSRDRLQFPADECRVRIAVRATRAKRCDRGSTGPNIPRLQGVAGRHTGDWVPTGSELGRSRSVALLYDSG